MSLGSAAGVLVVALLILEAANLALRAKQAGKTQEPRPKPSLRQAMAFLAFAALFAILMWAEHLWRLGHGDYAGVGVRHSWYWTASLWAAVAFCFGRLV